MTKDISFYNKHVQIITEKTCYSGFLPIQKYQLNHATFNGTTLKSVEREVMVRRNAVAAIVYDPHEKLVVLLEQFRAGAINDAQTPWLLEIIAGLVEAGENNEDVARREIHEEAGLTNIKNLHLIQSFYTSPGSSSEHVYLFAATAKLKGQTKEAIYGLDSEQEDIKRHIISFNDCFKLLQQGAISNSIAIIAIQWLQQQVYLNRL
ncbi:NUDIX domain-containing protein [Piscirickettsia salmonis]|uniref:NUDIX domain-containing protein n=1 Tax=Piscirickettsia salmonis TaxID=1238 RepID=UPI003EBEB70F